MGEGHTLYSNHDSDSKRRALTVTPLGHDSGSERDNHDELGEKKEFTMSL